MTREEMLEKALRAIGDWWENCPCGCARCDDLRAFYQAALALPAELSDWMKQEIADGAAPGTYAPQEFESLPKDGQ